MAIEGVLARRKCAEKWCATFWDPVPQFSVSLNREIFNLHDLWHSWKVASWQNTSKLLFGSPLTFRCGSDGNGPQTIVYDSSRDIRLFLDPLGILTKIMKIKDSTIQWDRNLRHRVPESCAPFPRTVPSYQNPLNCHMFCCFCLPSFRFSSFYQFECASCAQENWIEASPLQTCAMSQPLSSAWGTVCGHP